ncbi:hypothetical protein O6H91_11G082900 [Diphasiastrum complanatum]|uniref:Uncharacterized protein n=1 Tax=Diphasiastrum complanatum TaxID=34168 RepID=A0ACC2CB26_DIPCM|nr:hypothetical protein O6H91_11G082900 [Diphasiastrum complanatum]
MHWQSVEEFGVGFMEESKCKMKLAVEALEKLGLKRKLIINALRDLLKKCNGDWTHIEADNYLLLVDSYFERENENTEKKFNTRSKSNEQDNPLHREIGYQAMEATDTGEKTHTMEQSRLKSAASVAVAKFEEKAQLAVGHIAPKVEEVHNRETTPTSSSSSVSYKHSMIPATFLEDTQNLECKGNGLGSKHTLNKNLQTGAQNSALAPSARPPLVTNHSRNSTCSTDRVQKCKKKRLIMEQGVETENRSKHDIVVSQKNMKSRLEHAVKQTICREKQPQKLLAGVGSPKRKSVSSLLTKGVHLCKYRHNKTKCSVTSLSRKRRKLILSEDETCKEQNIVDSLLEDGAQLSNCKSNKVTDSAPMEGKSSEDRKKLCNMAGETFERHLKAQRSVNDTVLASPAAISDGGALEGRSTLAQPSSHACVPIMKGSAHRTNNRVKSGTDGHHRQTSMRRLKHNPLDISRGEEPIPIPFVNEFTKDILPDLFHYIPKNLIYQNAHINFSIARIGEDDCCSCVGSCVAAPIPCACTRETCGQYAYTPDGCLQESFLSESIKDKANDGSNLERYKSYCKDKICQIIIIKEGELPEPCRGHYPRRFVKECCSKCGCPRSCGNRVVQRGICHKLQVFWTPEGKGWGLRTAEDLPKGAFVCEYVGEIMTNYELYARNQTILKNAKHTYPVLLDADICSEQHLADEALCLDATFYGNVARCYDANMLDIPVSFDSADRHYYHHAFFTTRSVKAMEELTWDYSIDFEDAGHPIGCFCCLCGSEYCRGKQIST